MNLKITIIIIINMSLTVGETVYSQRGEGVVVSSNGCGWYDIRTNGIVHKARRPQLTTIPPTIPPTTPLQPNISLQQLISLAIRNERESKELEDTLYESVIRNSLDVPEENEKLGVKKECSICSYEKNCYKLECCDNDMCIKCWYEWVVKGKGDPKCVYCRKELKSLML
jgi:hypothetical protein